MTKNHITRTCIGVGVLSAASLLAGTAWGAQSACETAALEVLDAGEAGLSEITHVEPGDEFALAHCLVRGEIASHEGVDGSTYAIGYEVRLPDDWNGSFVHQFNGGNDGAVQPAVGELFGGDSADTALSRGFAVVSSNAGHDGEAFPDAGLAGGSRFGLDPQARRDYGYGAVATLNPVATALVERYYDESIAYSYGTGGSNGGRHAMVAAARMPEAFDGLLVGFPGFELPQAAVQHALDAQAFSAVNGDMREAFSQDDLDAVAQAVRAACDDLDGLADGIVYETMACQDAFDIRTLVCAEGADTGCLSAAQVEALSRSFAGPRNSAGEQLYTTWVYDTGIAGPNWRFWKLESGIPPWDNMPLIATMGAASLAQVFTTPPTEVGGSPEALEDYLLAFDFDTDAASIYATDETFSESAMAMMTPPEVDNPELAAFRDAGGKMIVFHGVSDPVFSVVNVMDWYDALDANNGDDAESFVKFYPVPGMTHGVNGPRTNDFDFFSALTEWVESGQAPEAVIAGVTADNEEGMAALGDITRKLCPYPQTAAYTGEDPAVAESFTCQ